MNRNKRRDLIIHALLIIIGFVTVLPYLVVINNSFRSNNEVISSYVGVPRSLSALMSLTWDRISSNGEELPDEEFLPHDEEGNPVTEADDGAVITHSSAIAYQWEELTRGYVFAWDVLRQYTLNTMFVAFMTVIGVLFVSSLSAYVFARYRFPGRNILFMVILSIMMIPGVLTLVPSFLLVKELNLLNTYWVLILPYIAGGQIMAIFLFRGFFEALPEDLFEAARIDGAGHARIYWNIVLPLSKPIISVVAIINILTVWNNFLWPFITNSDNKYHVIASGLYLLGQTEAASNQTVINAAFVLSALPLLVLFVYATKAFMRGVTSGAFKA